MSLENYRQYEEDLSRLAQGIWLDGVFVKYPGAPEQGFVDGFAEQWYTEFKSAKIFELDDDISFALEKTRANIKPTKLPFEIIFIDTKIVFEIRGLKFYVNGLLVHEIIDDKYDTLDEPVDIAIGYLVRSIDENVLNKYGAKCGAPGCKKLHFEIGGFVSALDTINQTVHCDAKHQFPTSYLKSISSKLKEFVMNFVNFIDEPNVTIIDRRRGAENISRRLRQGKAPLPPSKVIKLTGNLKRYINNIKTGNKMMYSHKFWVRGHWRHYYSDKFTTMQGKKQWIFPYVKGEGILVDKDYKLEDNELDILSDIDEEEALDNAGQQ